MKAAYREAIEHISVTEDMRARILSNIQNADVRSAKVRSYPVPVRCLAAAACFALLIAGTIALPNFHTPVPVASPPAVQNGILDRTEVSSLHELSQLVGFEVEELKDLPFHTIETLYIAYGTELAEVKYIGETQSLVFHKAVGNTDPSGDYTTYSDTLILELDNISVTLKGESGAYCLALWQDDAYSYSIRTSAAFSDVEWTQVLEPVD